MEPEPRWRVWLLCRDDAPPAVRADPGYAIEVAEAVARVAGRQNDGGHALEPDYQQHGRNASIAVSLTAAGATAAQNAARALFAGELPAWLTVTSAAARPWRGERERTNSDSPPNLTCSFCGKSQDDVKRLFAGHSVFICDECVELCAEIMAAEPTPA